MGARSVRQCEATGRGYGLPGPGLDPAEVYAKVFTRALRGYSITEVDTFLHEMGDELTRRQRGSTPRASAEDVRQVTFGTIRHGYAVLEVDEFLDRIAAELDHLDSEADQHRSPDQPLPELPWPDDPGSGPLGFTLAMRGYATGEVDAFLDRAAAELDQLRAGGGSAMTSANVRAARFTKVAKGYAMPEVDSYLDDLAAEFDQLAPPAPLPEPPKPRLAIPQFKIVLRGYATRDVDSLLARVEAEFERLRDAIEGRSSAYVPQLTPDDVNQAEFNRGMRGYAMDDVDDFLDEVAAELERLLHALEHRDPRL
jgi:DivIVA domain-containing protein